MYAKRIVALGRNTKYKLYKNNNLYFVEKFLVKQSFWRFIWEGSLVFSMELSLRNVCEFWAIFMRSIA